MDTHMAAAHNLISTTEALDRIQQATGHRPSRVTLHRWIAQHPGLALRLGGRNLPYAEKIDAIARGERLEVAAAGGSGERAAT